ncbi:MAG: amidohydrolase, partial [Acidobacteria bacterium]|nr:amidohydrolase [Acidobacteriota bacterium]
MNRSLRGSPALLPAVVVPLLAVVAGGCGVAIAPPADQTSHLTLDDFRGGAAACYDRVRQPYTAVVDTHIHFRPFG